MADYVPARGDLIGLDFDPHAGHEQAGRRPALVLTPVQYNRASGLAIVCPVTSQIKGYASEVALPEALRVHGVILADHARSVDWVARHATYLDAVPISVLSRVLSVLASLLGIVRPPTA